MDRAPAEVEGRTRERAAQDGDSVGTVGLWNDGDWEDKAMFMHEGNLVFMLYADDSNNSSSFSRNFSSSSSSSSSLLSVRVHLWTSL